MEITVVKYRRMGDATPRTWDGLWMPVTGGVVLWVSDQSQLFIPFHNIECIEQTITGTDVHTDRQLSRRLK